MANQQFRITGTIELITGQALKSLQDFMDKVLTVTNQASVRFSAVSTAIRDVGQVAKNTTVMMQGVNTVMTQIGSSTSGANQKFATLNNNMLKAVTTSLRGQTAFSGFDAAVNRASTSAGRLSGNALPLLNNNLGKFISAAMIANTEARQLSMGLTQVGSGARAGAAGLNTVTSAGRGAHATMGGTSNMLMGLSAALSAVAFTKLVNQMKDAAIQTENFHMQMSVIEHDVRKVDDIISNMRGYEIKTPFTLPELQNITVSLTKIAKLRGEGTKEIKEYTEIAGEYATVANKPIQKIAEGMTKMLGGNRMGVTILRNNVAGFASTRSIEDFNAMRKRKDASTVEMSKHGQMVNFVRDQDAMRDYTKWFITNLTNMELAEKRGMSLQGRIERMGANIFRVFEKGGQAIAPIIMYLADAIGTLAEKMLQLPDEFYLLSAGGIALLAALTSLVAIIAPMSFLFTALGTSLGGSVLTFNVLAGAAAALNGAFTALMMGMAGVVGVIYDVVAGGAGLAALAGSAGLLGTAMAALVTIGTVLIGTWMTFKGVVALTDSNVAGLAAAVAALTASIGILATTYAPQLANVLSLSVVSGAMAARGALYAVGAMAAWAAMEYMKATKQIEDSNKQMEDRIHAFDSGKVANRYDKEGKLVQESTLAKVERFDKMSPKDRAKAMSKEGYSKEQMESDRKSLVDMLDNAQDSQGDSTQQADDNMSMWDVASNYWDDVGYGAIKNVSGYDLDPRQKIKAGTVPSGSASGKTMRDRLRKAIASAGSLFGKTNKEQRGTAVEREADDIEEEVTGMRRKHKLGQYQKDPTDQFGEQTMLKRIQALKLETLGREDLHKVYMKLEEEEYSLKNEITDRKLELINRERASYEASGNLTLSKRRDLNKRELEVVDQSTKEGRKKHEGLVREGIKIDQEQIRNQTKAQIEITRVTQGERAARLEQLKLEKKDQEILGLSELQIKQLNAQKKLEIDRQYYRELKKLKQDVEDSAVQRSVDAATNASDTAEYDYENKGGEAGQVVKGRKLTTKAKINQIRQKGARERDAIQEKINDLGNSQGSDAANTRSQYQAQIEESKAREQAAIEETQRSSDRSIDEFGKKDRKRTTDNDKVKVGTRQGELDLAMEKLKEKRDETGKFDEFSTIEVLKEKMQLEMALAQMKADQEMETANAAEQEAIANELALEKNQINEKYVGLLKEQLDIKAAMEAKDKEKQNKDYFKSGPMSFEDAQKLEEERSAEFRKNYEEGQAKERAKKERMRVENILGMGGDVKKTAQDYMGSKSSGVTIKDETGKDVPHLRLTIEDPSGKTRDYNISKTSTEKKNQNPKNKNSQSRGDQCF